MKVTQEKLPASQVGLEIEVPAELIKKTYDKVVNNLLRTVRIPGFRPGKVPKQVLMQRFGSQSINAEVVQEVVDVAIKDAIKQEKIEAIGNFTLKSPFEDMLTGFAPDKGLTFSAAVDVQPTVTLKASKGFQIKAEEVKPEADKVEKTLDGYRTQMATLVPVEGRAVKLGDVAVVDYEGRFTKDGEEKDVPGGKAEKFQMDIETDKFIPGFIDGIVGMNSGDTKEISVQFPDEYGNEELAGCPAKFSITVHEIKERELPELDDEFAKDISDGDYDTVAELREMLEKRYADEAEDQTKQNKEAAILNELLNHVEVDLPETLIDRETESMLMQTAYQLQSQGLDVRQLFNQETIPRLKENSRPEAINRLKRTMALGEIAKQEKLEVSPAELTAKVNETLEEMGGQAAGIDPERLRSVLSEELLKDKILAWVEENSTLELVPQGSLAAEAAADEETAAADSDKKKKAAKPKAETAEAVEVEAVEVEAVEVEAVEVEAVEEKPKAEAKPKAEKAEAKAEEKPKAKKAAAPKKKS
jgi:trigger factor